MRIDRDLADRALVWLMKLAIALVAIGALLALVGCVITFEPPPAPLKPCREMPRGYCAYTDPR